MSYVKNTVAVPYLQKALTSNKMAESVIINSLGARGGKLSVEVLIFAMNERPNSELAVHASATLEWIGHQSSDLEVKRMVRGALRGGRKN